MCGIFGIVLNDRSLHSSSALVNDLEVLYSSAMLRGQDATGIAVNDGKSISVLRRECKPTEMVKGEDFKNLILEPFKTSVHEPLAVMGHSRLVTNGSLAIKENNQPVCTGQLVGIHNGIVTNASSLQNTLNNEFLSSAEIVSKPSFEGAGVVSDTQQFFQYIDQKFSKTNCIESSIKIAFNDLEGSASIALMSNNSIGFSLATNTGSLYYIYDQALGVFAFSSESIFLDNLLAETLIFEKGQVTRPERIDVNCYALVKVNPLSIKKGLMTGSKVISTDFFEAKPKIPFIFIHKSIDAMKRCSKCILPESYPGISFDDMGVCSLCTKHVNQKEFGEKALETVLDRYRRNNGDYDCLVGLSGGRDSSYGIYLLKTKYGMNPLAYTYDWGLTTDQSRQNQAKVCGLLGIEHIIRAPDVSKKRRHIRKNIRAWLRQPEMGMVPLFMAGDKDFYHYGRKLRKQYNLDLTVFCSGSLLEQRQFFVGFCGIKDDVTNTSRAYDYRFSVKAQMAAYYITRYLKNPSYINESFLDSIRSFLVSFMAKDDFLYLYEYLPWNEKEIESVLKNDLSWEADKKYGQNQWRMGDGQTAFTNYIFYTVAGFSEFDNFRSNQIRENLISRDEALRLVIEDNKPKWGALQYFAYVVGINLDEVLAQINNIPKLY